MTIAQEAATMLGNAHGPSLESGLGYNMVASQATYAMRQEQVINTGNTDYLARAPFLDTFQGMQKSFYKVGGDQPVARNVGVHLGNINVDRTRVYGLNLDGQLTEPYMTQ
ncbi:hypothetical protein COV17_03335 [Candidatus Woesearchaeota archaeon CG10_big_fil_rev_8_21_14_0_10_36_11]|nr:MAG: hypothetical protein COV17_03335 [Candidatus Woesearchaeota archaeon CG10_big_fil_rev_8_21_14_0_10_36_11]